MLVYCTYGYDDVRCMRVLVSSIM